MYPESKANGKLRPENISSAGLLIVISGASGVGKDTVTDALISHQDLSLRNFRRLITCADRPPRPGEVEGTHYFFVSPAELDAMYSKGELVEEPQTTGSSRKGTLKSEILKVLSGENKVWRIDPTLASKVASGEFFDEQFPGKLGEDLRERTIVFCITASSDALIKRRKKRDGKNYNSNEFALRDDQEKVFLEMLAMSAITIKNEEKLLESAIEQIISALHFSTARAST